MVSVSEYCNSFRGSGDKWSKKKIPDLDSNRYRIEDDGHCCCYRLVDVKNDIFYRLCFKENKKESDFYYADEIVTQYGNRYVYYKSAYRHYAIRDTHTNEEWEVPKKETCIKICEELNRKDMQRKNYQRVLEAKIRRLKDRVKVFEKNCSSAELEEIHKTKRWKK